MNITTYNTAAGYDTTIKERHYKPVKNLYIYTTKGRDRFHWAATPLKPHKVGNICYMTYRYSVLYFLNLSLEHFFPTENGNFCDNIQIRKPLSFRVLTRSRMPNRRNSQSKIEDFVHYKCISLLKSLLHRSETFT